MHGLDRRKGVAALVPAAAAAAAHRTHPRAARTRDSACHERDDLHAARHRHVRRLPVERSRRSIPNTIASAAQWTIQPLLYNGLTKYAHDGSVLPDLARAGSTRRT